MLVASSVLSAGISPLLAPHGNLLEGGAMSAGRDSWLEPIASQVGPGYGEQHAPPPVAEKATDAAQLGILGDGHLESLADLELLDEILNTLGPAEGQHFTLDSSLPAPSTSCTVPGLSASTQLQFGGSTGTGGTLPTDFGALRDPLHAGGVDVGLFVPGWSSEPTRAVGTSAAPAAAQAGASVQAGGAITSNNRHVVAVASDWSMEQLRQPLRSQFTRPAALQAEHAAAREGVPHADAPERHALRGVDHEGESFAGPDLGPGDGAGFTRMLQESAGEGIVNWEAAVGFQETFAMPMEEGSGSVHGSSSAQAALLQNPPNTDARLVQASELAHPGLAPSEPPVARTSPAASGVGIVPTPAVGQVESRQSPTGHVAGGPPEDTQGQHPAAGKPADLSQRLANLIKSARSKGPSPTSSVQFPLAPAHGLSSRAHAGAPGLTASRTTGGVPGQAAGAQVAELAQIRTAGPDLLAGGNVSGLSPVTPALVEREAALIQRPGSNEIPRPGALRTLRSSQDSVGSGGSWGSGSFASSAPDDALGHSSGSHRRAQDGDAAGARMASLLRGKRAASMRQDAEPSLATGNRAQRSSSLVREAAGLANVHLDSASQDELPLPMGHALGAQPHYLQGAQQPSAPAKGGGRMHGSASYPVSQGSDPAAPSPWMDGEMAGLPGTSPAPMHVGPNSGHFTLSPSLEAGTARGVVPHGIAPGAGIGGPGLGLQRVLPGLDEGELLRLQQELQAQLDGHSTRAQHASGAPPTTTEADRDGGQGLEAADRSRRQRIDLDSVLDGIWQEQRELTHGFPAARQQSSCLQGGSGDASLLLAHQSSASLQKEQGGLNARREPQNAAAQSLLPANGRWRGAGMRRSLSPPDSVSGAMGESALQGDLPMAGIQWRGASAASARRWAPWMPGADPKFPSGLEIPASAFEAMAMGRGSSAGAFADVASVSAAALGASSLMSPSRPVSLLGDGEAERDAEVEVELNAEQIRDHLLQLAQAVATCDQPEAVRLALLLRKCASPTGAPMQRMSFYLMQALAKRSEGCLGEEYVNEPPQTEEAEAMILEFAAQYPPMQFCYTTMACAIHEAIENESQVHIIDYALWAGQWPIVIRQLANQPTVRPKLKFTAIVAPPGHPSGAGPVLNVPALSAEISAVCSSCNIDLQFQAVVSRPEAVRPSMLGIEEGEAVVVNFAGRLATLADSSVLRSSPKDAALKVVLQLQPRVVTFVEWDCNQSIPFFLPRFRETLGFFARIFTSHDLLAERSSFGRRGFEDRVLAREMINLVACEGLQRMVRAETLDQLASRMLRVGFAPKRFSARTNGALQRMLTAYPPGFAVADHPVNGCQLKFQGGSILGASSWQPKVVPRSI